MSNVADMKEFYLTQKPEVAWFEFLKTSNSEPGTDRAERHAAARLAISLRDAEWARGEDTAELVRALIELYELKNWDVPHDSLSGIQAEAITVELKLRHDTIGWEGDYCVAELPTDNESFVTAWCAEIMRREEATSGS